MGYLRDSDGALFSKFLFGFFAGVGVGQVRVEIFVQDLRGLFAEITPFAPKKKKIITIRENKIRFENNFWKTSCLHNKDPDQCFYRTLHHNDNLTLNAAPKPLLKTQPDLASRKRDLRIMTASQVLCFS